MRTESKKLQIKWNGSLPVRRYALFRGVFCDSLIVVREEDFSTAPHWGGFIQWVGAVRPAETREVSTPFLED